ncbi:OmpH family outer membrane protein [Neptunicoccus cionae]|uniref:Molecular chaperone Skp n=1 Tax=Neptunicoccus cionae TaxID=2035344 RepID=A0A916VRW9_9RHOB|nr:OmpH family outer membrane protein [Amylibacter cionae]GGA24184.1 molecular chaperone Skp [Amylibacter cionae]
MTGRTLGLGAVLSTSFLVAVGSGVAAQTRDFPLYDQALPVVSINREALIQRSDLGRQLSEMLAERQSALVAENEELAARLEQEELDLTELRKSMSAEEFTPMAEAFDAKVKKTRREQDQKSVDLAKTLESMRFRFFRQAENIIVQLMQERGVMFVLDESAVWMSQGGDVTNTVIKRMNSAYAAGELSIE